MISLVQRIARKGPRGVAMALRWRAARQWHRLRTATATRYRAPDVEQLRAIEAGLLTLGIACSDYRVDLADFGHFLERFRFPDDYHGGVAGGVYLEKLLEHYVAWDLLGQREQGCERWPYLDVAGAASPWARLLREAGHEAWAIDLDPPPSVAGLPYVLRGDATATPFAPGSVGSASLQCAYEMFAGDSDTRLLAELARILRPGGRAVILPLYMHVQPCYYQSPDHYGSAAGDAGARRFLRDDVWGIATSRKYSPQTLIERVWRPAERAGLLPGLQILRNGADAGPDVYLHFILTLDRP